jgi:chorismate mutase
MKKLFALRGAVCCQNNADDIQKQVALLYDSLLETNTLAESGIVSLIFSVTDDLDALNHAAAMRAAGRAGDLALFAVREAAASSLPRCIRVLLHCYMDENAIPRHVYQNGAEVLRPDRGSDGNR